MCGEEGRTRSGSSREMVVGERDKGSRGGNLCGGKGVPQQQQD